MNNVAFVVQHDVSIVPIFDLQQKADYAVRSHWRDEIVACSLKYLALIKSILNGSKSISDLELQGIFSVFLDEVLVHSEISLSAELVTRFCIWNTLDDTALKYYIKI